MLLSCVGGSQSDTEITGIQNKLERIKIRNRFLLLSRNREH